MNIRYTAIAAIFVAIPLLYAASPIPSHPPKPVISAVRAIEIASLYAMAENADNLYCSSAILDEGGMLPAPHGSARHWKVIFQAEDIDRSVSTIVYVSMDGAASNIPPAR